MKNLTPFLFFLSCIISITLFQSCKDDDDINKCPDGFMGADCETFDFTQIQALLDAGNTPISLFNAGALLYDLYGMNYKGGLIFYLDTINGNGMVAAANDFETDFIWGKEGRDSPAPTVWDGNHDAYEGADIGHGISNTDSIVTIDNEMELGFVTAAEACYNSTEEGFDDWFLPSRAEMNRIYLNLKEKGVGNFPTNSNSDVYWTSTEHGVNSAWVITMNSGSQSFANKETANHTRAAREFEN